MSNAFVVGQYAEGQGGVYIGLTAQGRHLFAAAAPLDGEFEFGGYGDALEGYSDLDGAENTRKLLERGGHPAALAASEYATDGHKDFYLPSHRELLQVVAAEGFNDDGEYTWTSTPYGSTSAWAAGFEGGDVDYWDRSSASSGFVPSAASSLDQFIPLPRRAGAVCIESRCAMPRPEFLGTAGENVATSV